MFSICNVSPLCPRERFFRTKTDRRRDRTCNYFRNHLRGKLSHFLCDISKRGGLSFFDDIDWAVLFRKKLEGTKGTVLKKKLESLIDKTKSVNFLNLVFSNLLSRVSYE